MLEKHVFQITIKTVIHTQTHARRSVAAILVCSCADAELFTNNSRAIWLIDRQIAERVAYKLIDGNGTVSVRQAAFCSAALHPASRASSIYTSRLCIMLELYYRRSGFYYGSEIVRQSQGNHVALFCAPWKAGGLTKQLNGPAGAVAATCINAFKQPDFRYDLRQRRRMIARSTGASPPGCWIWQRKCSAFMPLLYLLRRCGFTY